MARIMSVDYEAIPGQAKQIRALGQELNKEVSIVYQSITNMHKSWYGKRYNELVKSFNTIIPQINEMLTLVVGDIPYTLEVVANNYSQADKGANATSASKTSPNKIANLTIFNDTGMKFITSEVSATQTSVSNNFKNANNKMNAIESTYGKIQWESEAANAFKTKFTKLKTQIISSFEDLNTQFTKLMSQALQDVQSAEKSNTVQ